LEQFCEGCGCKFVNVANQRNLQSPLKKVRNGFDGNWGERSDGLRGSPKPFSAVIPIIVPAVDEGQLWAAAVGVSTRAILYGLESALKVSWQFRTTRTTSSAQEGSQP
jgi:hypothetical protein